MSWIITYHAVEKQTHEQQKQQDVCAHPEAMLSWLAEARAPDHTMPIELWSPIQGDPGYFVHVTGNTCFWHGDSHMVDELLVRFENGTGSRVEPVVLERQRERFARYVSDFPDDRFEYVLRVETRDHKRVPRTDKRFVQALEQTVRDDDDARND